ncbi:hypothetical protein CR51_36315 [Caballeronia megalochromosomata]|jgi:hypothetical protein|nr:hypothetical protein CR51_36315 [Caballeronia megalochromosomata]
MAMTRTKWLVAAASGLILGGCAQDFQQHPPSPPGSTGTQQNAGGFEEFDAFTDPRLDITGITGPIGILRTVGDQVYLNFQPQHGPVEIFSGAKIATGPGSGALVQFLAPIAQACSVRVSQLQKGNIYGGTRNCDHRVETQTSALVVSEAGGTEYEVSMIGNDTRVSVVRGRATVRLSTGMGGVRTLGAGQEVRVTSTSLGVPEPLHHAIDWRRRFPPGNGYPSPTVSSEPGPDCKQYGMIAQQQYRDNIAHRCNLSDTSWQPDAVDNVHWCEQVGAAVAARAQRDRSERLSQCMRAASTPAYPAPDKASASGGGVPPLHTKTPQGQQPPAQPFRSGQLAIDAGKLTRYKQLEESAPGSATPQIK